MNKKILITSIIFLILFLSQSIFAQDSTKYFKQFHFSLGIGVPYGGVGINVEIYPFEYSGISIGFGEYTGKVYAFVIGGKVTPFSQQAIIQPFITAYYGIVGESKEKLILNSADDYYELSSTNKDPTGKTGTSFGLGIRINTQSIFQNIDIGFNLKRNFKIPSTEKEVKPWFGEIFIGIGNYL